MPATPRTRGSWSPAIAAINAGMRIPFELAAFLALVVIPIIPVWAFHFFPSQDGPAHLENAMALLRYAGDPLLREYYVINRLTIPNWFGHAVAAGLFSFSPPIVAEKILLTGYLILLPLGFRYAISNRARLLGMSFLIFPFVQAFHYQMGFWNFSWSVALFCLSVR